MYLMCKNKAVYDITNDKVLNKDLLPGIMMACPCRQTYEYFVNSRRSKCHLSTARALSLYNTSDYSVLDTETRMLSLVDCYWLRLENDTVKFGDISPFYHLDSVNIASLYIPGIQDKEWKSQRTLVKYGKTSDAEYAAHDLCYKLGIPVAKVSKGVGVLYIESFTSSSEMLEQANQSSFDIYNYTDDDILNYLGLYPGIETLLIDTIVGNGDRHPGNFGWLRSSTSGKYLRPAPLYDFDHALGDTYGSLINDFVSLLKHQDGLLVNFVKNKLQSVDRLDTLQVFKDRAKMLLQEMG